ncbi:MAG TPA: methionyl-tRNA formyltransferase [Candidatus Saccharimonadales bacterium]|nr:methionyl-tRNA formyltransferase [Candidatus Saccharimonadales bacterium]
MKKILCPIVFFGSGPVAAKSLSLLLEFCEIEVIITKPTVRLATNPVQDIAKELGIPIFIPIDSERLDKIFKNNKFSSHLGIVIDFGLIISPQVINYFQNGILNSHFSLLPEWRGADPITFSILSGQLETGVSLMLINEKMDDGLLLAQSEYKIPPDYTTPELTDKLIKLSNKLIKASLRKYLAGKLKPYPQDLTIPPSYSRKLTKDDGRIDWQKPARQIEREIRAYIDWPRSYTSLGGKQIIITKAAVSGRVLDKPAGVFVVSAKQLLVQTGENSLDILEIKPAGKPAMAAESFIAGYKALIDSQE